EQQLIASKTPDELVAQATKEFKDLPSTEEEKAVWLHNLERNNPAAYERFMQLDTAYRAKEQEAFEQRQAEVQAQPQHIAQPRPPQYQELPMAPSHQAKVECALLVRDQIDQTIRREFPDVRSMADANTLAKVNPQRATRLLQLAGMRGQVLQGAWNEYVAGQRGAEQAQSLANYVADQNERAEMKIPELAAGGKTAAAFKQAAIETMHSLGYDDAAITQAMNAGQIGLREQKLIAAATRERLAEQNDQATRDRLRSKRGRPQVPPVQRPGLRTDIPTATEIDVSRGLQALANADARGASPNIQARIAAETYAAARRAATGNRGK